MLVEFFDLERDTIAQVGRVAFDGAANEGPGAQHMAARSGATSCYIGHRKALGPDSHEPVLLLCMRVVFWGASLTIPVFEGGPFDTEHSATPSRLRLTD
ncbi:hypothetical protein CHU98_g1906 [Xylaria longipes]|nr:hypothetical protein CHU98_g1906 [Xylaria longipes]